MTTYTKKLVWGSVIVFVMSFFSGIFAYFLRILLARNLTQEEYGLVYAVFALFGLLSVFQHMGLQDALVQSISKFKVKDELEKIKTAIFTTFIIQIITAFILALIGILLSDWLANNYFNNALAKPVIILYAISIFLSPLETVFMAVFQAWQKMSYYSLVNFLKMFLLLAISAVLIHYDYGIYSILIAYIAVYAVPILIYIPLTSKYFIPNFLFAEKYFDYSIAKDLLSYGFPVILSAVAGIVLTYTDTVMITMFKGLEETALYNAAIPTSRLLWMLPQAFIGILFPVAAELWLKNKQYLRIGIVQLYRYSFAIILPLALTLFSYPELVLRILFGASYEPASNALKILCIGGILFSVATVNSALLNSIGKPSINSRISWLAAIFNFLANLIVIPLYGIEGAAFSTLLAFALMFAATLFYIKKEIEISLPWIDWIKTVFVSLIFLALISVLKQKLILSMWIELFLSITFASIIYVILLFLLKIITIAEIKDLMQKIKI